jgi:single-strand DNA-binding protein
MSNHITIHGNIGQEPELRFTQSGMAIIEFSVGDTYGKDDKKKTTWHNVVAFGRLAENFAASAAKGNSVIVSGRYEVEEYTKKDGTKGKSVKVVADEIGMSLRWDRWVKDQTEQVMAKIGNVFPNARQVDQFEEF